MKTLKLIALAAGALMLSSSCRNAENSSESIDAVPVPEADIAEVEVHGPVTVENPQAVSMLNLPDTTHADVLVSAIIRNNSCDSVSVRVMTSIRENEAMRSEIPVKRIMNNLNVISASTALNVFVGKERKLSEIVELAPGEALEVSKVFPIDAPRLWRPDGECSKNLYDIRISASVGGEENCVRDLTMGIRR